MMTQNQKNRLSFPHLGGGRLEVALLVTVALACKTGDSVRGHDDDTNPPRPPTQEPVLKDYSGEEEQALDDLRALNTLKQSIQMDVNSWKRARTSKSGPTFGGEANKLGARIIDKCDDLERSADSLLRSDAVQRMPSAGSELRGLVRFAKDTREAVRDASSE